MKTKPSELIGNSLSTLMLNSGYEDWENADSWTEISDECWNQVMKCFGLKQVGLTGSGQRSDIVFLNDEGKNIEKCQNPASENINAMYKLRENVFSREVLLWEKIVGQDFPKPKTEE